MAACGGSLDADQYGAADGLVKELDGALRVAWLVSCRGDRIARDDDGPGKKS